MLTTLADMYAIFASGVRAGQTSKLPDRLDYAVDDAARGKLDTQVERVSDVGASQHRGDV